MATKYSYTKAVVGFDIAQLTYEIEQNVTIVTDLDHIDFSNPDLDIWFDSAISGAEETELGIVVTASPDANIPMPTEDIVANILIGSLEGLKLKGDDTNPTFQVNVSVGACRESTGIYTITVSSEITVDITASGVNGLDTGSEASSTWYAVYAIDDTSGNNSPAGLFSTNSTTPTLPNGYNVYRRIGWVKNDSSSDFLSFAQKGCGVDRTYYHLEGKPTINVLSLGSATDWTDVDLGSLMPPTASDVLLSVGFKTRAAGVAGDKLFLRMKDATKQVIDVAPGSKNTNNMLVPVEMSTDASQFIEYKVDSLENRADLWVYGWKDEL